MLRLNGQGMSMRTRGDLPIVALPAVVLHTNCQESAIDFDLTETHEQEPCVRVGA